MDRNELVERMAEASWRAMLRWACSCNPRLEWAELSAEHRHMLLCEARASLAVAEPVIKAGGPLDS